MTRGRFIAFEGGEGMGKSTQAKLLVEALGRLGIKAILTREPGGTPGAEAIRNLLLHPPAESWPAEAEALLFAAARSDHVAKRVVPALDAGDWVICDRFVDSSRAYQGVAGGLGDETILALHAVGSAGLRPDLTLVLAAGEASVSARLERRDGDTSDAIGGRGADFHNKVNQAFRDFAQHEPVRFAVIEGDGTVEEVHARVMRAVEPFLGGNA